MTRSIIELLAWHTSMLSGGLQSNPFSEVLEREDHDDLTQFDLLIDEEPCMNSKASNSNIIPFAHQQMSAAGAFHRVPDRSSLEPVDPADPRTNDARLIPPVYISTYYQLIDFMTEMMVFRNLANYPTEQGHVIKEVWESLVDALDSFIRGELKLTPDKEETRIIYAQFVLLEQRKRQDQLPSAKLWNDDYQFHWNEMLQIAQYYLNVNQRT